MSRWRIYVEGTEVDVPEDLSAQFTYAIDDIKDFASRNTNFSKTVVLPGTGRNNKTFGHIFEIGTGNLHNPAAANVGYNFNAAKGAKAIATLDNIPVFKGVIRIMEIIITGVDIEYETALFGELGGLIAAMGDKKLEDLDFSAYDHIYNLVNVQGSWSATTGEGYYYPLIDYGYTADGKTFPIETFRPALHAKEYLDKIFAAAGYTYESTFLNDTYFKKLIVPYNALYPSIEVSTILHMTKASRPMTVGTTYLLAFDAQVGTSYIQVNSAKDRFTWRRSETVSTKVSFAFDYSAASGPMTIYIYANGVYVGGETVNLLGPASHSFEQILDVHPTDYIEIKLLKPTGLGVTLSNIVFKIQGQPTVRIPIQYGDSIVMGDMIPKNVLQKDFLVWLIKMYNLYLDEDNVIERHLRIEPFIDYYDPANHLDWDGKIDRSQAVKIKPMGEITARTYEYKYKDDSDYYNDLYKKKYGVSYGSFVYDSGYEFIKDKQSVEVGFSPTPSVGYAGTDRVIPAIYKKSATTIERTASNIRILLRSAAPITCVSYTVQYFNQFLGTIVTATLTDYPYAGHLDDPDAPTTDLCFGVPSEFYFTIVTGYLSANLFNVFWSFYISEITDKDSKVLTASFKLTPVDIYNLDFSKLIFLAGQLWRLNSVMDYTTDQPEVTKCELLKVIDIQ